MNIDLNLILAIGGVVVIAGAWLMFSIWRRAQRGELFYEDQGRMIDALTLLKEEKQRPPPAVQRQRIEEWERKDRAGSA